MWAYTFLHARSSCTAVRGHELFGNGRARGILRAQGPWPYRPDGFFGPTKQWALSRITAHTVIRTMDDACSPSRKKRNPISGRRRRRHAADERPSTPARTWIGRAVAGAFTAPHGIDAGSRVKREVPDLGRTNACVRSGFRWRMKLHERFVRRFVAMSRRTYHNTKPLGMCPLDALWYFKPLYELIFFNI